MTTTIAASEVDDLCDAVSAKVKDEAFRKEHEKNRAPLAMVAFAGLVVERIVRPNNGIMIKKYFQGLTMEVPPSLACSDPHYHSIIGQKLLLVDWKKMFNLQIPCPSCKTTTLSNDRTNFSKNKILFPIFVLDGPPQWCMVMSMKCNKCKARFDSNNSEILCKLPAYAMSAYPVDSKYATGNNNSHIGRDATNVFDLLLPTYGNGDLCSRMLYNAINRSYIEKAASYYSYHIEKESTTTTPYVERDGQYITFYPPLGDAIRDWYDEASNTSHNPWGISDHDRHTREIQGVQCHSIFAQDHTHEVTKNYLHKKKIGAEALWDVSTETGEIASAVLVPTTKTIHFSHAAIQLSKRPSFNPTAMCSDTWPCKSDYWSLVIGRHVKGRLGLFHFIQRIMKTLRKKHVDYFEAINALLDAVYYYNQEDYEALLRALKNGTMSSSSTKYTDDDISEMKATKTFRQRYNKYLRKEIRHPLVLRSKLEEWFHRFKCSESTDQSRPARGRLDPRTQQPLFTAELKSNGQHAKTKLSIYRTRYHWRGCMTPSVRIHSRPTV